MNKKTVTIIIILVAIALGVGVYLVSIPPKKITEQNTSVTNIKDATYLIEGQPVTLKNGISVIPAAPGSASNVTTKYFGNEVQHDFDGDGRVDTAFILTQNSAGSGTFYYVVAALNTVNGYVGSDAVLLGDRIAPQTITIDEGKTAIGTNRQNVIVVNYADRKPSESFAVAPSVGKSIWLKLDIQTMQFGVVARNFEGETDTGKMSLGMKTWSWVSTTYSDGKEVKPRIQNKFNLTFKNDKSFSASTDCNGVGGEYTASDNKITFTKMMSTQMFCENSQEAEFSKMLAETQNYLFTSKGELVLTLKFDSGSVIFK